MAQRDVFQEERQHKTSLLEPPNLKNTEQRMPTGSSHAGTPQGMRQHLDIDTM